MATHEVTVRPDGRWEGRLTRRPLPEHDDSIDALSPDERAVLTEVWLGRAASERRVGEAFGVVERALVALGAEPSLVDLAHRAVDDEMRHHELSRLVASRYAGCEVASPPSLALVVPRHERAEPRLRHVLHVVGHCSLNETIASAFLEATLAQSRASLAVAVLRELLSDEIDHARIGWGLVASLDRDTREQVQTWLPEVAVANLRMWRQAPRRYADDDTLAAHGAPSASVVEEALRMAFRDLILPGFEQLGIDVERLQKWLDQGAPT
jgi:hypothetical protein